MSTTKKSKAELTRQNKAAQEALSVEITAHNQTRDLHSKAVTDLLEVNKKNISLEQEMERFRIEIHSLVRGRDTIAVRLDYRISQLRDLRNVWSRYMSAQAVGAAADVVEELRQVAHNKMVALLEVDLTEHQVEQYRNPNQCDEDKAAQPMASQIDHATLRGRHRAAALATSFRY